jgi:tetratricopeptide (TPR) repeat protein
VTPLRAATGVAICLAAACAPRKVAVDPAIAGRATLAQADANLRAGCFDCLVEALRQYESTRAIPALAAQATTGAVRAAALLGLRERELGTTDSGYLERARELSVGDPVLRQEFAPLAEVIDIYPWRAGAGRSGRPDSALTIFSNREQRVEGLRALAQRDELSAYVWVAYTCESGIGRTMGNPEMRAAIGMWAELPLLAFRLAICPTSGLSALDEVVGREPRFKEAAFFQGLNATRSASPAVALSSRKLDEADAHYREAYAWRKTWPAVTLAIANASMTTEEFQAAREFYDETLALAPMFPDALLGKLRALTYLSRHEDAMAVADELIVISRYPGDAHYWKAYNELSLERYDPAWLDIEAADRSLINSEVPKLAGIIAIDRHEIDVARQKLEISRQRNPNDCQTLYYLHLVLADQRKWPETVNGAVAAAGCIDSAEAGLRAQIEEIRMSEAPEARKARQIAAREQQIASGIRMRATCWFNAAVGSYNTRKIDDARMYAAKLDGDAQYGDRARDLVSQLPR